MLRRYIPGPGVDQRVLMITCGSSTDCTPNQWGTDIYAYTADRLGHVIAVTHTDTGAIERYVYSPYGVELRGDESGNPFRYTGRRYDAETGLYYYRARYYDADLGRFLSTDPIGYADQWNLYAYVGNDPLNATDPTGEFGLVGAVFGGAIELGFQLATEEGRASYAAAGRALANRDFGGAWEAAGNNITKVAISSAAGAVGQVGATRVAQGASMLARGASNIRTAETIVATGNLVGNAAVGAATSGVSAQAQNTLTGSNLNVARAAFGGGVGGAAGSAASQLIRGSSQNLADATGNLISTPSGSTAAPLAIHGRLASVIEGVGSGIAEYTGNNAASNPFIEIDDERHR